MIESTFIDGNTVRANDIRQHYLRYGGKGTPLILVPGIVSPAPLWSFVGERLGKAFDTYIVDVRGRGLSETGDGLDYSLDAYAADVNGLAQKLGLEKYILLGHSMGARIAIRTARLYGDMLERIVLVDPPVSGPGRRPYPVILANVLGMLEKACRGELWEATKANSTWTEHSTRVRAEWLHTCNKVAVETTHRNFHEEDIFPDLPHIKVPSNLIVAGKGGTIQPPDVEEIRKLAPSMSIDYVETAGHMIPFEDFEGFFTAVSKVLGTKL
jgi:N-formylmaleamate deformylase